jgi:aryl-alcohol dehydrogenase-like predicted oxidoreductase
VHHRPLGNTGLSASIAALGCGGPSRLGLRTGHNEAHAASIVDLAINLGVNTIDTAESYGTETAVARAIKHHDRSKLIIATKKSVKQHGPFHAVTNQPQNDTHDAWRKRHDARPFLAAALLRRGLEHSLQRLGTDYIDIYFLHAPLPHEIDRAAETLFPEMDRLRDEGKLRFTAVSEMFAEDTTHRMLRRAHDQNIWDVVMVGFNILNQSARETVLKPNDARVRTGAGRTNPAGGTRAGTMAMFAVRKALRNAAELTKTLTMGTPEQRDRAHADQRCRLVRTLEDHPDIASIPDAAYRFAAHEPGIDTVLTGTGNPDHLKQNLASITAPPLPAEVHAAIVRAFEGVDSLSGNG